jgi:biopolymer transport protein ExbD
VQYEPTTTKPENVSLSVRGDGAGGCEVYWGLTRVNSEELLERAVKKLEDEIERQGGVENITEETMPEAHIRGDVNTPISASVAPSSPCSAQASPASASFPSRLPAPP